MSAGVTITVRSLRPDSASDESALVHQAAAESAFADDDAEEACAYIIKTEMAAEGMVKTVVFERPEAARRFRALLSRTAPQLRADD